METIDVEIRWSDKNYAAGWGFPEVGAVIVTAKTLEEVKKEFSETLQWHVKTMEEDGDKLPSWLVNNDYVINYHLHISALLREAEKLTTMAALSRETGINQKLLSHYASSLKEPRPSQKAKIIAGLHSIGNRFLAMC